VPNHEDVEELKTKKICHQCVGEEYLKVEIKRSGEIARCSYCDRKAECCSVGEIAERIETAFEQHYTRTSDQSDGESVIYAIMNATEIPETTAEDVQAILGEKHEDIEAAKVGEETEFAAGSHYVGKGANDQAWQAEWFNFERSLKTEARFFSGTAEAHLAAIFGGVDAMRATDGRPLVIEAGPAATISSVYRARVFQADEPLKEALCRPDRYLGSPPSGMATAGRMNARGISVFYGASDPEVAIAEVRPPVGSQVAVAQFEIIRPIRLLDLTALGAVRESGSIFDREFASRLERATFLRSLSQRIARPVMPNDEAFEYLPTQAIADFLATENDPRLDGIVFPSVQVGGNALNVVLFHGAARVAELEFPPGTEITASTRQWDDEGWYVEYSVIEEVPNKKPSKRKKGYSVADLYYKFTPEPDFDARRPTLRISLDSIRVNVVQSVKFEWRNIRFRGIA